MTKNKTIMLALAGLVMSSCATTPVEEESASGTNGTSLSSEGKTSIVPPSGEAITLSKAFSDLASAMEAEKNSGNISLDLQPIGTLDVELAHNWYVQKNATSSEAASSSEGYEKLTSSMDFYLQNSSKISAKIDHLDSTDPKEVDAQLNVSLTGGIKRKKTTSAEITEFKNNNLSLPAYIDNDCAYVDTTDPQIKNLIIFVLDSIIPVTPGASSSSNDMEDDIEKYIGKKLALPLESAKESAEQAIGSNIFNWEKYIEEVNGLSEHENELNPYMSAMSNGEEEYLYINLKGQQIGEFSTLLDSFEESEEGETSSSSSETSKKETVYRDDDEIIAKATFSKNELMSIEATANIKSETLDKEVANIDLVVAIIGPRLADGEKLAKYDDFVSISGGAAITFGKEKPTMLTDYSEYELVDTKSSSSLSE